MALYVQPDAESLKRAEDAAWREQRADARLVCDEHGKPIVTVVGRRDHEQFWRYVEQKRQEPGRTLPFTGQATLAEGVTATRRWRRFVARAER